MQALLTRAIDRIWPMRTGAQMLILGYGLPLQSIVSADSDGTLAMFMPAAMGASPCPVHGLNQVALVDAAALPVPDSSVDFVIAVHLIEGLAEPESALREIWRVLKGHGRLLAVVPNRRGLWAQGDGTPLGQGQPYSPSQLRDVLKQQGFLIDAVGQSLYAPPGIDRYGLSVAARLERYGAVIMPRFGGLLLAEAGKRIYAPGSVRAAPRHRLVVPVTAAG